MSEHERILKADSHKLLSEIAKKFQDVCGNHVKAVALRGDPRDALVDKIERLKPTMVFMSNRGTVQIYSGLGPIRRVLLGSVSQHLVNHATAPIMIIPFKD
jgi:nucleotide-binding universal stress UspA family protein